MRAYAMLLALVVAPGAASFAQEPAGQDQQPQEQEKVVNFRATELIGKEVQNPQGERLGQVREIIIDPSGQARYLVIAYGGFLGVGDSLTVVPWEFTQPAPGKELLVIAVSRETLIQAPTFTSGVWQSGDMRWLARVDRYYQARRPRTAMDFARLDTNGDGRLSQAEVEQVKGLYERFQLFDADKDGSLSQSEYSTFEALQRAPRKPRTKPQSSPGPRTQ